MEPITAALIAACIQGDAPQGDSARTRWEHQLGADITYFIRQFTNFNGGVGGDMYLTPEHFIAYKKGVGRWRLRAGLGGTLYAATDTGGVYSNSDQERRSWSLDGRVGIERPAALGKRWSAYIGLDLMAGVWRSSRYRLDPTFTNGDEETDGLRLGAGPLLGLEFKLNGSIALVTETTAYLWWSRARSRLTDYYGQPLIQGYNETVKLDYVPPARLFLLWCF